MTDRFRTSFGWNSIDLAAVPHGTEFADRTVSFQFVPLIGLGKVNFHQKVKFRQKKIRRPGDTLTGFLFVCIGTHI